MLSGSAVNERRAVVPVVALVARRCALWHRCRLGCQASFISSEPWLWQTARPPSGQAHRLDLEQRCRLQTLRLSSRLRVTVPSSGRPKGRCAPFVPPLMSNVRPLVLSHCMLSVVFGTCPSIERRASVVEAKGGTCARCESGAS